MVVSPKIEKLPKDLADATAHRESVEATILQQPKRGLLALALSLLFREKPQTHQGFTPENQTRMDIPQDLQ